MSDSADLPTSCRRDSGPRAGIEQRLRLVSQTITKTDGAGTPINSWQLFWFYDASGRPYAGIDRKLSTTAGSTHSFYLVTDDRGDVLELLEADHIAFGSYRYDAYGRPTETTARETSTTAMSVSWMAPITEDRNPLRYAGYVYDTHSGLYYLQRRYYDAITRQFLSRDPLKSDGNESPYQYCRGNPVAGTDPWGLRMIIAESGGGGGRKTDPRTLRHLQMLNELSLLKSSGPEKDSALKVWGESLGESLKVWKHPGLTGRSFVYGASGGMFYDPLADYPEAKLVAEGILMFTPGPGGKVKTGWRALSLAAGKGDDVADVARIVRRAGEAARRR